MEIAELVGRFKFYAENHVDIRHSDLGAKHHAFFHLEAEEVHAAVNGGIKFPCLLLQTPDSEKSGGYDQMTESLSFTFVVLKKLESISKAQLLDDCKNICDDIFNLILLDFVNDVLPGVVVSSASGITGPIGGKIYGWGVTIDIEDGYDAEVNSEKWLHLIN